MTSDGIAREKMGQVRIVKNLITLTNVSVNEEFLVGWVIKC